MSTTSVLLKQLLSPDALNVLMLLVFWTLSHPPLNSPLFPTVPSVAPANVSGGNGRRHELVILWEVSPRTHHRCRSCVPTQVQARTHIESGTWVYFSYITNNDLYLLTKQQAPYWQSLNSENSKYSFQNVQDFSEVLYLFSKTKSIAADDNTF